MVDLLGQSLPLLLSIAGIGLIIAEALAPGAHFIVIGIALLVAGLLGLLLPPLASPLALAVVVFVAGALALYGYRSLDVYGGKGSGQTSSSDSLRGTSGRVTERVTETSGQVKLDKGGFNPLYAARTLEGEIPEGERVMVIDPGGGNVVTVESLDADVDEIDRELARARQRRATDGLEAADEEREREPER